MHVKRIAGALGAKIEGVDVLNEPDPAVWHAVRTALVEHSLLVFPNQNLDPVTMETFGENFGPVLAPTWVTKANFAPENQKVFVLSSSPDRMRYAGSTWHSDYSFTEKPADLSWINLHKVPSVGGDTAFASTQAAWDALSPRMQIYLDGLVAVHDNAHRHRLQYMADDAPLTRTELAQLPPAKHPLVRRHPQSGKRALYVSEALVERIVGLPPRESDATLRFLHEHCAQPQFGYRHAWTPGDLVIWDNRCTNHTAVQDYDANEIREGYLASGYFTEDLDK